MKLVICTSLALAMIACGDDPVTAADAGFADASSVADSGVRALCPMLEGPACTKSESCGMPSPASPAMCPTCRPRFTEASCAYGACQPLTDKLGSITVLVGISAVRGAIRSFLLTAVAGETAGGLQLTCADLTAGRVTFDEACVTVIDSRPFNLADLQPSNDVYPTFSSQYPTSARSLFVIQGYTELFGQGDPLGMACVEAEAGIMPIPPRTMPFLSVDLVR